jgi:hypothetical protein
MFSEYMRASQQEQQNPGKKAKTPAENKRALSDQKKRRAEQ